MERQRGDLFESKDEAYAHCVAQDFHMGRGIAVRFKQLFGSQFFLFSQGTPVGGVSRLETNYQGRKLLVYYLVTKRLSRDKPLWSEFRSSVEQLKEQCIRDGIKSLSIPKIGCGLDRLNFSQVVDCINETFDGSGIRVTMYFMKDDSDYGNYD